MEVAAAKLGRKQGGKLDIVNLKGDPLFLLTLRSEQGCFPAYHMNKEHWISVALDGTANETLLKMLVEESFRQTLPSPLKEKGKTSSKKGTLNGKGKKG